ncbi:hypothetical protein ANCCAN_11751 [Ancylostoma caninum]|uniref:Uncharacterized protein n=1 Tax=Ancylostoma caninum TaxID=29170 RepID=A0A368GCY5_ANCCA|nr:hypothetical protein ANCCAN_11751 [Ancylostoma caninum]
MMLVRLGDVYQKWGQIRYTEKSFTSLPKYGDVRALLLANMSRRIENSSLDYWMMYLLVQISDEERFVLRTTEAIKQEQQKEERGEAIPVNVVLDRNRYCSRFKLFICCFTEKNKIMHTTYVWFDMNSFLVKTVRTYTDDKQ